MKPLHYESTSQICTLVLQVKKIQHSGQSDALVKFTLITLDIGIHIIIHTHRLVPSDPGFPEYLVTRHSPLITATGRRWPVSVSCVKMPAEDGLSGSGALWHGQLEINSTLCSTCQLE